MRPARALSACRAEPEFTSQRRDPVTAMRPARALERPPCRTRNSPFNARDPATDAAGEGAGAPAVPNPEFTTQRRDPVTAMRPARALERPPCRTRSSPSTTIWSLRCGRRLGGRINRGGTGVRGRAFDAAAASNVPAPMMAKAAESVSRSMARPKTSGPSTDPRLMPSTITLLAGPGAPGLWITTV